MCTLCKKNVKNWIRNALECVHLGYSEHKHAFLLVHRSSGRIVESRDVHFEEPSRVRIETETTQDKADTENSPVEESNSDSESSVDLEEPLDIKSDNDDDGDDSDASSEGYGTAGSSSSNARSSQAPDNVQKASGSFVNEFRATETSPSKSATSKNPWNHTNSPYLAQLKH
jgi:hypothetical protein